MTSNLLVSYFSSQGYWKLLSIS